MGDRAPAAARSGGADLNRGVSSGEQNYETDPSLYPVNQPIPKVESRAQCTGEAKYFDDIETVTGELHAAFVLSTRANCSLGEVNASDALAIDGVVDYVNFTDIPGENNHNHFMGAPEEIFSSGRVRERKVNVYKIVID